MHSRLSRCCGTRLPTYLGFATIGFISAVIPFIAFTANYLIIPFPRWVVLLIETVPALATTLLLPHVLHHVPYWMRPLAVGAAWILAAFICTVTPPNVDPPARIFTSVLMAATSAAMNASALGLMRYYDKSAVAGWGAGVGSGSLFCAVIPYVLAVWRQSFLRNYIEKAYTLIAVFLVVFFVVLPSPPVSYPTARAPLNATDGTRGKDDAEHAQEGPALLMRDPRDEHPHPFTFKARVLLVQQIFWPYIFPLFLAFFAQAAVSPGMSRAYPVSKSFETFFAYSTCSSFAFQLGGFVSRALTPLTQLRSTRVPFIGLAIAASVMTFNALFPIVSSPTVTGLLLFVLGLTGGAISMIILSTTLDDRTLGNGVSKEFCLQVLGSGQIAGVIAGGLLGTVLESGLCSLGSQGVERWCHTTR